MISFDACFGDPLRTINLKDETLPKLIVFLKSNDDIFCAGVMFNAGKEIAKQIASILIHGWGVNFYSSTYVSIPTGNHGLALACSQDLTLILASLKIRSKLPLRNFSLASRVKASHKGWYK